MVSGISQPVSDDGSGEVFHGQWVAPSYGSLVAQPRTGHAVGAACARDRPARGRVAARLVPAHQRSHHNARVPSSPSCLPGPGVLGGMLDEQLAAAPYTALQGDQGSLTLADNWLWPAPSSTKRETTPQTREREAPLRPVREGRNRGQLTQESAMFGSETFIVRITDNTMAPRVRAGGT